MAKEPGFSSVKPQLTQWWTTCKITRQQAEIDKTAKRLYARKAQFYDPVEKAIGVPWYMVAVIDERESGAKGGVLHNGEFIIGTGKKTKLVPAGRGPFKTWQEAAVDALSMPGKNFNQVKREDWSIELVLYCLEAYNGWGYRMYHPKTPSPYVWSCTNIYDDSPRGKYVADGKWKDGVTDQQIGCAPILKSLIALNKQNAPVSGPVIAAAAAVGGATVVASNAPYNWMPWIIGGTIAVAFVGGMWAWLTKRSQKDVAIATIPSSPV